MVTISDPSLREFLFVGRVAGGMYMCIGICECMCVKLSMGPGTNFPTENRVFVTIRKRVNIKEFTVDFFPQTNDCLTSQTYI